MSSFIFKFGKHKGKSLQVVQKIDPSYIEWAKKNAPGLLKEYKTVSNKVEPSPRREPPSSDGKITPSGLQPNTDFLSQGPHEKLE